MMISQGTGNTPIWSNTLTSPTIVTSLTTSSTSFDLLTTTATTINFGLAATTLNIATNNVTKTINLGTSGTSSTIVNIGTRATSSSTINLQAPIINVGRNTPSAGTGVNTFITGPEVSGTTNVTAGHVYITGGGAGHEEVFDVGTVTGGDIYLNAGFSSTTAGTSVKGGVRVGTLTDTGSVSIGRTGITTTVTGTFNHSGTTSPIQLNGAAGTSGQVLTSAGSGNTPTWGLTQTSLATGFSIAGGTTSKTLTVSNTMTLAGTDTRTYTFPTTNATIARTDAAQTFTGTQTIDIIEASSVSSTTADIFGNVTTGTVGIADGLTTGTLNIGNGTTSSSGRTVNINTNATGMVTVTTNIGSSVIGGTINLYSGSGNINLVNGGTITSPNVTSNNSGNIVIATGGTTTSGNSGSISIDVGSAAGTAGSITLGTARASALSIGRSGVTTTLTGTVNYAGASSPIQVNSSAGSAGQVLTSAGAGTTPTWNNPDLFTSGAGTAPGTNAGTNYPIFPSANDSISLPIGTYKVEFFVRSTVATSTVSATMNFSMLGAGTAAGSFAAVVQSFAGSGTNGADNIFSVTPFGSGGTAITTASAVAGRNYLAHGNGVLRITTAGTIIPSILWSSTLTSGSVTLDSGNYMMITQLSNSGTAASVGSWS
jgi:hypothetical protein